jgi:hypothetical protein
MDWRNLFKPKMPHKDALMLAVGVFIGMMVCHYFG